MTIDLVPLKHFSARVEAGWSMVPGYPLNPGDYAVTMQSPDHEAIVRRIRAERETRKSKNGRLANYPLTRA